MLAKEENILTLMGLTGGTEEEAAKRLATRVAITVGDGVGSSLLGRDVSDLLGRSLSVEAAANYPDIEVALGASFRTTAPARIHVELGPDGLTISHRNAVGRVDDRVPGLFRKIAACYVAGNVIARAIGGNQFALLPDPFVVLFSTYGVTAQNLLRRIKLDDAVLVGAGGVGNGLMWGLQELDLEGRLTIVDPKKISAGNLNRCLFFREEDIGEDKATLLASRTTRPGLEVDGFVGSFAELRALRGRVRRVFTTPDSREARRSVQGELPLEVLDASTTGSSAVVVHSHRQPTDGACLACIYPHIPLEDHRLTHIAEGLGLNLHEVRRGFVDEQIARKLATLNPNRDPASLIGRAFETIYKEQCGQGILLNAAGQQAVAPLAFVSNLAGALLALELVRYETPPIGSRSNYLTLDPWRPPTLRARRDRARRRECTYCGGEGRSAFREVWPEIDWPSVPGECFPGVDTTANV
jgi:molybdopterin/thiamine biosynthesis adenylyltransferase